MTINGSENMTMKDTLGHKIDKRCKDVWSTNKGKHWSSAKACAEELGVKVASVYQCCNGFVLTCKGHELSYEENVSEVREKQSKTIDAQNKELAKKNERIAELERKAALWDAYDAEQKAARKAEENRIKAIESADKKVARRQRMYDRKMEEVQHAYARLMEAKDERNALGEAM